MVEGEGAVSDRRTRDSLPVVQTGVGRGRQPPGDLGRVFQTEESVLQNLREGWSGVGKPQGPAASSSLKPGC